MELGWINLFGGIIVILILIPNIIYALKQREHDDTGKSILQVLNAFEQIGRYACMVLMWLPLFVWNFGFGSAEELLIYLIANGVLLLSYYLLQGRYLRKRTLSIAMALAIIPTTIFLLSGILLRHWLLAIAAILFGIVHCSITYISHKK